MLHKEKWDKSKPEDFLKVLTEIRTLLEEIKSNGDQLLKANTSDRGLLQSPYSEDKG